MGKDKKKDKKEKKNKKHKKERSRKPSTSDSSESSGGEWVEKESSEKSAARPVEINPMPVDREDDWGSIFGGVSTVDIRKAKEAEKVKEKVSMEVKPGRSSRELNPYWKDGGTGLPPERDVERNSNFRKPNDNDSRSDKSSLSPYSSGSRFKNPEDDGDRNSSSRGSRFKRPDDTDFDTGRCKKPDDGSGRSSGSKFRRPDGDSYRRSSHNDDDVDRSSPSRSGRFRRPDDDGPSTGGFKKSDDDVRSSSGSRFRRSDDDSDRRDKYSSRSSRSSDEPEKSRRGWRKSDPTSDSQPTTTSAKSNRDSNSPPREKIIVDKSPSPPPQPKVLTSDELNELNAKIFRAKITGKMDVVAKLTKELENSRREEVEKTVILTQTDGKGYTRPVKRDDRGQGSKNKRKVQTHENSKRVRYFADDDDYSLQDMYEKEKYSSARDQEADFMNLMGKEMARKDGSLALDDPFEETASIDNRDKKDKQQWDRAVRDQAKKEKIYDECKWCLGAKRMNQDLVIKTKQKVYLSCPPFQSLTEGHCLIIPHSHVSCSTQVDEDVWDEVMELRKELVRKLEKNDEDCVFFENASYLHKHPHMIIHCVPLPREIGDMAPIYFKKALLDCESEWTNNKKVVELAGRGVRKAVPKGLSYFFVDFGDQAGYAHVIEDQKLFPNNFAQEIIGGMLDLNHELWRKQRNVSEEELNKNVQYLKQLIEDDD